MQQEEFINIYHAHKALVARLLYNYVKEKNELEDLIQEVFLRLWKYRESIDLQNEFLKSYLLKTARNTALTYLENKSINSHSEEFNEEIHTIDQVSRKLTLHTKNKINSNYREALARLPEKAKKVYLLNREEGLTYNEIGRLLNISPRTVEVHISRVIKSLRKELSEYKTFL